MKSRSLFARLSLPVFIIAGAVCSYALDNISNARKPDPRQLLEAVQQAANDKLEGDYEIQLEPTASEDKFHGTAKAKDGMLFDLTGEFKDGKVRFEGWSANGSGLVFGLGQKPKGNPWLWLYIYSAALCLFVIGIGHALLGVFGWRQLQSPSKERLLRLCALVNSLFAALMVYGLVTVIQQWPRSHPVFDV